MTTKRILTLAAVGTLAAVSTVAISVTSWLSASAADTSAVHLHLGTDAQRFTYGSTVQNITVAKNSYAINSAEPLIKLTSSATGGKSSPGLADYALGVRESPSSGNGSPCAQVAGSEVLTLQPGTQIANRLFRQVRFDLEMTGDALVSVKLTGPTGSHTYKLQTGRAITSDQTNDLDYVRSAPYTVSSGGLDEVGALDDVDACASPNSSGPNSGGNDNCQWTITPGFDFNKIDVSSTGGTASIEGGGDFAAGSDNDTLFVLGGSAPVANNDSAEVGENEASVLVDVLANDTDADNDPLTISGITSAPGSGTAVVENGQIRYTPNAGFAGTDTFQYKATDGIFLSNPGIVSVRVCSDEEQVITDDAAILATFKRLTDVSVCKINTVDVSTSESSVLFQPHGDPNETANYRGVITFGPKTPSFSGAGAIQLLLKYDVTGTGNSYAPVPWCISPTFDGDGLVDGATMPNLVDTWCIATETTTGVGDDPLDPQLVQTTWQVFGQDDPKFQ